MANKPIIIVCGEPNSVFSELLIKSQKKYKTKKPIILIGSLNLLKKQLKKIKLAYNFNLITSKENIHNLKNNKINIINIDYNFKKPFEKISEKSNDFISKSFEEAFYIIRKYNISGMINGPISKKNFLKNKYQGITEYLSNKYKLKDKYSMLIYNKNLSVCPITTHEPLKTVAKKINKNSIIKKTILVSNFYRKILNKDPKIAITGLNPHCENFSELNEEKKYIEPAIKFLKKKLYNVYGPYPADTIFLKQNIKKFNVIIGMYHDQVLGPIKALKGFNAINITLGLPFLRISPDHGPNFNMIGKNKSDPQSLLEAIKFLDKLK